MNDHSMDDVQGTVTRLDELDTGGDPAATAIQIGGDPTVAAIQVDKVILLLGENFLDSLGMLAEELTEKDIHRIVNLCIRMQVIVEVN
jgi:hypothetical protein